MALPTARYPEAESLQKRALSMKEKILGPEDPELATSLNYLAYIYHDQGKYSEAEPLYQRALSITEKSFPPEDQMLR